jgi:hypothetical protein
MPSPSVILSVTERRRREVESKDPEDAYRTLPNQGVLPRPWLALLANLTETSGFFLSRFRFDECRPLLMIRGLPKLSDLSMLQRRKRERV